MQNRADLRKSLIALHVSPLAERHPRLYKSARLQMSGFNYREFAGSRASVAGKWSNLASLSTASQGAWGVRLPKPMWTYCLLNLLIPSPSEAFQAPDQCWNMKAKNCECWKPKLNCIPDLDLRTGYFKHQCVWWSSHRLLRALFWSEMASCHLRILQKELNDLIWMDYQKCDTYRAFGLFGFDSSPNLITRHGNSLFTQRSVIFAALASQAHGSLSENLHDWTCSLDLQG